MKNIYIQLTGNDCYDHLKIRLPHKFLCKELYDAGITLHAGKQLNDYLIDGCDAFVFHGSISPDFMRILKKIKGKKIGWLMDDLLTDIPEWNWVKSRMDYSHLETLTTCLNSSVSIGFTTNNLQKAIGYEDKSYILPNLLDIEKIPSYRERGDRIYLWSGGDSHASDVELLSNVNKIKKQFIFFGMMPEALTEYYHHSADIHIKKRPIHKNIGFVDIVPYEKYCAYMNNLPADIGLAPLVDCEFNRCKSPLKYMEYSAQSMITIAQNISPYSDVIVHKENGYLVDDWKGLSKIKVSNKVRKNAYNDVIKNWTWNNEEKRGQWLNFYLSLI